MFGLVARIFTVLNNRTKNKLLPLAKNNVFTPPEEDFMDIEDDNNQIIEERFSINTRVFSDSFSSYQISDFENLRLILKRVNHSVWFGIGSLHTNTIESVCHQIKSISNNFTGLSIELLKKTFNNDESEITKYLDGWLCLALFIREVRLKKLNWSKRIDLLCDYLII